MTCDVYVQCQNSKSRISGGLSRLQYAPLALFCEDTLAISEHLQEQRATIV